ncbi:inner nuclear membrane protein Man1 [Nelusetta ayraudi]|uniref:inner nuclear membrane protein Man1 n=1 Tax=Nelusetta ayraudi TaxID=303726 RepID=UPI003F6F874B
MAAAAQLSDDELFTELKLLGFTPGPLTENTRPVYLKKLKKLREEQQEKQKKQQQQPQPRSKGRSNGNGANSASSGASRGSSYSNSASSRASNSVGPRPLVRDVTHLNSSRRAGRKSSVLGFSSDESDADVPAAVRRKSGSSERRDAAAAALGSGGFQAESAAPEHPSAASSGSPAASGSVSPAWAASNPDCGGCYCCSRDVKSHCRSLNGCRVSSWSSSSGRDREQNRNRDYSDSESDSEATSLVFFGASRLQPSRSTTATATSPRFHHSSTAAAVIERGSQTRPLNRNNLEVEQLEEEEVEEEMKKRRTPSSSRRTTNSERSSTGAEQNHHHDDEDEDEDDDHKEPTSSSSRSAAGLRSRFPSYSRFSRFQDHQDQNRRAEDELLQQFQRAEGGQAALPGGCCCFSAHYLSMLLLAAAVVFFLLLGLVYLRVRGSGFTAAPVEEQQEKRHPFGSDFDSSYTKSEKDLILKLLLNLHNHLAHIAGGHDCGDAQHPNRSLSLDEAVAFLQNQNQEFEDLVLTSLEWLLRTGQDVGIRLMGEVANELPTDLSEVRRLESTHPSMPLSCRLRRALLTVACRVLLLSAVLCCVLSTAWLVKYRWRRQQEESRQMYVMVAQIVDMLRSQSEACQENQDLLPYLPIPNIRDSLLQPQDRARLGRVWDQAEAFLSTKESRVRTETQRVDGADFLVWRWIQPPIGCERSSPQAPPTSSSKVWQGKAFPLDRRNSPPNSLTPCLKIRNMFDPVMEVGEHWDKVIQQAVLEKCSDNDGIVHIAVDKNSREGCVYVKCLSADHSGRAFKALHGSWFDGKLVTVKYLRLDRYHQRFPQAQDCTVPLRANAANANANTNSTTSSQLHHRSSS